VRYPTASQMSTISKLNYYKSPYGRRITARAASMRRKKAAAVKMVRRIKAAKIAKTIAKNKFKIFRKFAQRKLLKRRIRGF